jgi:hypothetical protein
MPTRLKKSLIITGGTGVHTRCITLRRGERTATNSGVAFNGASPLTQQIFVGNDIRTTGNVQFNSVTSSAEYDLGGYTLLTDRWTNNFSAGGSINVTGNLTIPGNATLSGKVTAEEIIAELTSSNVIFKSGSTQFGDTIDDTHYVTGSVYQSGSFSLLGSGNITEFSNDTTLADGSSTALATESSSKAYTDVQLASSGIPTTADTYLRKNYNKTASSVSNNTASFSAVTASAGSLENTLGESISLTATNEGDYLFFNNGQIMEHDALTIQQSGSTFLLIVDPSSIGYNLVSDDEIIAWGKFNA